MSTRECFRSSNLASWKALTASLAAGAQRVEWTEPLRIIQVMNRIRREVRHNHIHFPTHGGLDLHGAAHSAEPGCIELNVGGNEGGSFLVTRPVRLVLNIVGNDPLGEWTYFWYETAPLAPSGVYEDVGPIDDEDGVDSETLLELRPGKYVDREHGEAGYYGRDENGREVPLPSTARVIHRHLFGGPFLIVPKGGGWNANRRLGNYRARHAKQSESEFAAFVQGVVDELQQRGVYGVDPRGR